MSARTDTVNQLALDRSAADFAAGPADVTAQTVLIDCLGVEFIDVIVDVTNLGTGPATKMFVLGRASGKAEPDVTAGGADWTTINTEAVDTATGIATIVPYLGEMALPAAGQYMVSFPVRSRYFSALVWLDAPASSRGNVYFFRR